MTTPAAGGGSLQERTYKGCAKFDDYFVLDKLGEGTFGEVYKAREKKTNRIFALKKILVHNEKDGFPITALREIKLLKMLDHINILRLDNMIVDRAANKDRKKTATIYTVTPYMDHDLAGLLENPAVQFSEAQIKCYMLQLLEGVRYLHHSHILHRDMKAANLLINNRGVLQIADFGLARHYEEPVPQAGRPAGEARREYTTLVVTRWYRPPELLLQLRKYTTAIDMWGVGCVFGEMFKRHPILAGKSDLNQLQIIFDLVGSPNEENMPGWNDLPGCEGAQSFSPRKGNLSHVFKEQSTSAVSLLSDLLRLNWRQRITAIDALQHPYFRNDPRPARPEELPRYDDSHELDRRRFRDQKAAPPPAPAGGTVGMGPEGEWGSNDNRTSNRNDRGWARDRNGRPPPQRGPPGAYDQRRPRDPPGPGGSSRPGWSRPPGPDGLPARPPAPMDGGVPRNKDTYIPSYSDASRAPPRADRDLPARRGPPPRDDRDYRRDDRDRDPYRQRDRPPPRDYDRDDRPPARDRDRPPQRSRSRSPGAERRERDKELYRR